VSVSDRQSLELPATARSASHGRHFVVGALERWRLDSLVDSAALLSTEVITNAVLHARTPLTVSVERVGDSCVQISVSDGSGFVPQRRQVGGDSTNGRGIDLLDRLAASWSVVSTTLGKTVQFTLDSSLDPWAEFLGTDWLANDL
jgi:anti-sigma regulatory factor (Ser/Thr protein kinase)